MLSVALLTIPCAYPAVFVAVSPPYAGALPGEAQAAAVPLLKRAAVLRLLEQLRAGVHKGELVRVVVPVVKELPHEAVKVCQSVERKITSFKV